MTIIQISDVPISKSDDLLTSFQRLVFWDSIKSSPLPPLEAVGSINENAHPKAFVSSAQYIFVRFE
jgi:hypothetical protein